ncbi:MAG: hypothetical protein ACPGVZ_05345 [Myxococcota bacterium]
MVDPPCAFEGGGRDGVVVGVEPSTRGTRGDSSKRALKAFLQAAASQDRCSKMHNGGGLRTRVEVTHRS